MHLKYAPSRGGWPLFFRVFSIFLNYTTAMHAAAHPAIPTDIDVLFVDLDGTLITSDCTYESLASAAVASPGAAARAMLQELPSRGLAAMKATLAQIAAPDAQTLPYIEASLDYLRLCKQHGVRLVLATASTMAVARPVAEHLGLFEDIIATTPDGPNLKGRAKRAAMQDWCLAHGCTRMGYMGDSSADRPIFAAVDRAVFVSHHPRKPRDPAAFVHTVHAGVDRPGAVLRLMRPHHWIKNLLVFTPVLTSHRWTDASVVIASLLAFVAMSLVASAVYVSNDLCDIASDRRHPRKHKRPVASGEVRAPTAIRLSLVLLAAALVLGFAALPWQAGVMILGYAVLATWYSIRLKRLPGVDVATIAGLHLWRVWVGGAATGIGVSAWLLAFTAATFFSIACIKRFAELRHGRTLVDGQLRGRAYRRSHSRRIGVIGVAAAALAVLVLLIYVTSPTAAHLYQQPSWLYLACGLTTLWFARAWRLARQGRMIDDPLLFAVRDPLSWAAAAGVLATLALAM